LVTVAALAVATVGCTAEIDPLAGRGATGPTVLVEITERPATSLIATSTVSELVVFSGPTAASELVTKLDHPLPTGAPLVFQVVDAEGDWLEVLLPLRPNGSTGWILAKQVTLTETPYRIEIDVSDHRLVVWRRGELLVDAPVAIGTGSTPTPIGDFYLNELLQPPDPGGIYGPYAYGLSGYSETLTDFRGGDGVIGIHGTNEPESLGTDVSHGCVRVANEVITDMVSFLPLGTPVIISP
jgi:lipoprotein-anchoring transpeptidase ErfK/SrfK